MSRALTAGTIAIAAMSVSACDFIYGVRREAHVDIAPSSECVKQVILSTPGVTSVNEWQVRQSGQELTIHGLHELDGTVRYFSYSGANGSRIRGVVQFDSNWRGYNVFSDTDLYMNAKPPQTEIDATRPVMQKIEFGLSIKCGLTDLSRKIHENCPGVECTPLE